MTIAYTLEERVNKLLSVPLFEGYSREDLKLFTEYHDARPWIWKQFYRFAAELLPIAQQKGRKFGAKLIMERVRWEHEFSNEKISDDEFTICNDFTALYARLLAWKVQAFQNVFEFKRPTGLASKRVVGGSNDLFPRQWGARD